MQSSTVAVNPTTSSVPPAPLNLVPEPDGFFDGGKIEARRVVHTGFSVFWFVMYSEC